MALLAEASELQGGTGLGFVKPAIYNLFVPYVDFTDVTIGSNGTPKYQAMPATIK